MAGDLVAKRMFTLTATPKPPQSIHTKNRTKKKSGVLASELFQNKLGGRSSCRKDVFTLLRRLAPQFIQRNLSTIYPKFIQNLSKIYPQSKYPIRELRIEECAAKD